MLGLLRKSTITLLFISTASAWSEVSYVERTISLNFKSCESQYKYEALAFLRVGTCRVEFPSPTATVNEEPYTQEFIFPRPEGEVIIDLKWDLSGDYSAQFHIPGARTKEEYAWQNMAPYWQEVINKVSGEVKARGFAIPRGGATPLKTTEVIFGRVLAYNKTTKLSSDDCIRSYTTQAPSGYGAGCRVGSSAFRELYSGPDIQVQFPHERGIIKAVLTLHPNSYDIFYGFYIQDKMIPGHPVYGRDEFKSQMAKIISALPSSPTGRTYRVRESQEWKPAKDETFEGFVHETHALDNLNLQACQNSFFNLDAFRGYCHLGERKIGSQHVFFGTSPRERVYETSTPDRFAQVQLLSGGKQSLVIISFVDKEGSVQPDFPQWQTSEGYLRKALDEIQVAFPYWIWKSTP